MKKIHYLENIGNQKIAQGLAEVSTYAADKLNQYTEISLNTKLFVLIFDAGGNQSKIQSSTGEWLVSYNANNRPISFTQGNTRVECNYDYMGRQYLRKVYKNNSSRPTINDRYIHRVYLRLGALNMNNGADFYQALLWDSTEPQATRPLALLNNDGTYYYGHDFNKNVTELFNSNGDIVNHYDYRPYGALLWSKESIPNPIQYSSEVYDPELGLISYNYRHYNPEDGRWLTRDPIQEKGGLNLYGFVGNNPLLWDDFLGLRAITVAEQNIIDCIKKTVEKYVNEAQTCDLELKNKIDKMLHSLQKNIQAVTGKDPINLKIQIEALRQFCSPSGYYCHPEEEARCSPFVRDVLNEVATKAFSRADGPIAGTFVNASTTEMKKRFKVDLPIISESEMKPGDIVASGFKDVEITNSAHVGINLGDGLYISQSTYKQTSELSINDQSTLKIRDISTIQGSHERDTYRDTSKLK